MNAGSLTDQPPQWTPHLCVLPARGSPVLQVQVCMGDATMQALTAFWLKAVKVESSLCTKYTVPMAIVVIHLLGLEKIRAA